MRTLYSKKYKLTKSYKIFILYVIDALIALLVWKKDRPKPHFKRILVIRLDNLGDILLTRPLLCSLRSAYPTAVIDVLIRKESINILVFDRCIDNVYVLSPNINRQLKMKYDLIIEPKGRLDYAFLAWRLRPKFSIGYGDAGGGPFFDISLFQPEQNPIEKNREICIKLNIQYKKNIPAFDIPLELRNAFSKYNMHTLISPFSSRKEKNWDKNLFLELAMKLKNNGASIVFCGESSRKEEFELFFNKKFDVVLFSGSQLAQWISMIASVKLVIASDSAIIHLAAAASVPSIALFGNEDPTIWHQYNSTKHKVIKKSNNVNDISIEDIVKCIDGVDR